MSAIIQNDSPRSIPISRTRTVDMSGGAATTTTTTRKTGSPSSCSFKELIVEQREHIALIKFNRPATKNALNRRAYYELIRALNKAAIDAQTTVVVIAGGGGGGELGLGDTFSSGNDLNELKNYTEPAKFFRSANFVLRRLVSTFVHFPKVLVALVTGPCLGVAFTLSALCDVIYATESARFEAPFTRLGICPEAGSTFTLPLALGRVKAAEVLLFGAPLSAREALQFGFVARLYRDNDDLESLLWPQLCVWSQLPPESLRISKKLLRTGERQALLGALLAECSELEKLRGGETHLRALADFWNRKTNKSKL